MLIDYYIEFIIGDFSKFSSGTKIKVKYSLPGFPGDSDGKESVRNSTPRLEDPLEKNTHSSILAWRILWTKEPGGLQSMGLQGVRYDRLSD